MADEHLRRLMREAATGGPEAKARLKAARLRGGDQAALRRLKLAAYLGSAAALEQVDAAEKTVVAKLAWDAAAQAPAVCPS